MANDNRIDLIARVDVEESAQQIIKEDLPNLQRKINENGKIKIDCSIDTKNFDVLRKQISEFSKGLKIDVNGNNIENTILSNADKVKENLSGVENTLADIKNKYTESFTAIFDNEGFIAAEKNLDVLRDRLAELGQVTTVGVYNKDEGMDSLHKIEASIKNTNGEVRTLNFLLDKTGTEFEYIGGSFNDKGVIKRIEDTEKAVSKFKKELATFEQSHTAINSGLTEPLNEVRTMIERLASGETTIEAVQKSMDNLKTTAADIGKSLKATGSSFNIFDNAVNKANNFENTLKELEIEINKLSRSDRKDSLSSDFVQARLGVTQLFDIESAFGRNEEWAETYKNVSSLIQTMTNDLKIARKEDAEFQKEWSKALKTEEKEIALKEQAIAKESELQEKRRSDYWQGRFDESVKGLTAENEELKKMKQYYEEVEKEMQNFSKTQKSLSSNVDSSLKQITSQIGGSIFKNNNIGIAEMSSYSGVNVDAVINKYRELQSLIRTAETPEQLKAVENELNILKPEFDKIINSSKQFKAELRNASADQTFENRLKKITAQVQSFEQANSKATTSLKQMSDGKTFAQGWEDLKESLNTSNLNADGLKHINEQLATFKAEANSAGLTSSSFFKNMGEQIKGVVTQYVSLTFAISKIGNAINELKSIDDILTEISKTSDRTTESLQRLGETSFDRANQFGRKASDYLYGVQEMSRAGFGEIQSENLAELSILAQSAGDLTTELANDYIIATNAAYKFNGNIEKLNATLDSQNYITNNNALSMEDLASATRLAASQAANAGIGIDELTAATGTMIATTRESGDVAARAFRGIIMNLQQTKATAGEIGDGGLDITTESLTKYEKAVQDLGVSIKEVKNGVTQLRNPMEILRDLSIAVSKESEGSIKVANLISSVGGKYRGNQLIALLENWSTYEKMLSEFNSEGAIGSSMSEATKSANNWSGSLNQLSNSWTEFVSKIVNSEDAIQTIRTLNNLIQNASDSGSAEALGRITKTIADLLSAIGTITGKIGTIPTLLGAGATVKGLGELPNMPTYVLIQ